MRWEPQRGGYTWPADDLPLERATKVLALRGRKLGAEVPQSFPMLR